MNILYKQIQDYLVKTGKRIHKKSGSIQDIGRAKQYLTAEDLLIEQELKALINEKYPDHLFFAEEENFQVKKGQDMWVVDPISSTRNFIDGMAYYSIVVSHVSGGQVRFATVYDPTMNELFTAFKNNGSFLNGRKLEIKKSAHPMDRVLFQLSFEWINQVLARKMFSELSRYDLYRPRGSHALNYCHLAAGRYDGAVCFAKDSFCDFAGSLMITEAGGKFSNQKGGADVRPEDRMFVCGREDLYADLKRIVDEAVERKT